MKQKSVVAAAVLVVGAALLACGAIDGGDAQKPVDAVNAGDEHTLVFGGTVYWGPTNGEAVDRAFVRIVDSAGSTRCVVTDCDGTFALRRADAVNLVFPFMVGVERVIEPEAKTTTPLVSTKMWTPIEKSEACSTCHTTKSQIHLFDSDEQASVNKLAPTGSCAPGVVPEVVVCPEER